MMIAVITSGSERTQSNIRCYDSLDDMDLSEVTIVEKRLSMALLKEADYKINKAFFLQVINHSNNYIWIPEGYLNKITRITENGDDIEIITDELNRDALHDILLSPQGSKDPINWPFNILMLYPYIQTPNESETIQVEAFGFEYRDGKICNRMYPAKIIVTLTR